MSKSLFFSAICFALAFFISLNVVLSGNLNFQQISVGASLIQNKIVQAKLSELGYYDGLIDGIYNENTKNAVKKFQEDNSIAVNGVINSVTAQALGITTNPQASSQLYLLAKLIYSEARGEVYAGQVAVGAVVLNRVKSPDFPNTLEGVIYQPWAFTALHDGQFALEPNSTAYQAAQDALNGWDPSYGCLYYYNPATATSSWIFTRTTVVQIGNHIFAI